jgi:hypothetical protein
MPPRTSINKSEGNANLGRNRRPGRRNVQAFTLIELLLAVSLLVVVTGAMIFSFTNLARHAQVEEGTLRMEGLLRFAGAQAAHTGRRVQLVFGETATNLPSSSSDNIRMTWEPDPLGQPGHFEEFTEASAELQAVNDLVQIESVQLHCPESAGSASRTSENRDVVDEQSPESIVPEPMPSITFYPDGSTDSAEIILTVRDTDEPQRVSVQMVGLTGSISHRSICENKEEGQAAHSKRAPLISAAETK